MGKKFGRKNIVLSLTILQSDFSLTAIVKDLFVMKICASMLTIFLLHSINSQI